ncbi:MAG: ADP-ribosylglycohydrolase family protein [Micrococcales bacterium]|nr:ADP-ribosylglycohydrolase family protein [Micrococcales bacterium]MCL2668537.1 ADP-ribosylglycohydrolase family protein [Micrococcales bacterium]
MWCAAHFMDSYEQALWTVVSALGDRDTTCAITGRILVPEPCDIPTPWLDAAEKPFLSAFFLSEV